MIPMRMFRGIFDPIWLASLDIFSAAATFVRLHDDHREEVVKVSGQNRSRLPLGLATV